VSRVHHHTTALGLANGDEPDGPAALHGPAAPHGPAGQQPGADTQERAEPGSADDFREVMRHWATGVCVVTTQGADGPAGCTISSLMSVSLSPPLLVIALATDSVTLGAIGRAGAFGVNVLGADQGDLGQRFATGEHRDRFRGVACWYQRQLPLLPEAVACVICTVRDIAPCADHVLVIGEPVWHMVRRHLPPLIRFRSGYRQLAEITDGGGPQARP